MTTLIFFGASIAILIYLVRLVIKIIRHKTITYTLLTLIFVIVTYSGLGGIFYFIRSDKPVSLGTDICFDDWCPTVTRIQKPIILGIENQQLNPQGQFIILNI